jgi:DsbC/DsbD-like thiol-disulfide interchange protein
MSHSCDPARVLIRAALLLVFTGALPLEAGASEASAWSKSAQSQARLIEGESPPGGPDRLAGLEIRLEPQFITYWRDPGDAGVAPSFSFAGSTNLKSATVLYPVPRRLDEAGAVAFGYEGDVTFPIRIEAEDPSRPVGLKVAFDYAACHDICLPAHADLHLDLDGRASAVAGRVSDALAAVPRRASIGAAASPAIRHVTPGHDGGFSVTASGADAGSTLFVEAPEGFAYAVEPSQSSTGGRMFPVKRLDHPKGVEQPPAPVILTLATSAGAIEVPVRLDGPTPKP